jgi:hypothetical protein
VRGEPEGGQQAPHGSRLGHRPQDPPWTATARTDEQMRVTGDEFTDGGLTLEDTLEIVRHLHALGELDYFTVSGSSAAPRTP